MCDLCDQDANYFHTAECVYDHLVKELQDSTLIGASYVCRELHSPEGRVLAFQNAPPMRGWRLRLRYTETVDEEPDPQRQDLVELTSRADAQLAFRSLREGTASV